MNLGAMGLWPVERGQVIPASRVARVTKTSPGSPEYRLLLLRISQAIVAAFQRERGETVGVRLVRDEIHVLTHDGQAKHSQRLAKHAIRKTRKALKLATAVDTSELSGEERDRLNRAVIVQTLTLEGYGQAKSRFRTGRRPSLLDPG